MHTQIYTQKKRFPYPPSLLHNTLSKNITTKKEIFNIIKHMFPKTTYSPPACKKIKSIKNNKSISKKTTKNPYKNNLLLTISPNNFNKNFQLKNKPPLKQSLSFRLIFAYYSSPLFTLYLTFPKNKITYTLFYSHTHSQKSKHYKYP